MLPSVTEITGPSKAMPDWDKFSIIFSPLQESSLDSVPHVLPMTPFCSSRWRASVVLGLLLSEQRTCWGCYATL
jgi:hypothetical protein